MERRGTDPARPLKNGLSRHLAADGKFVDEVVGLVSFVDGESGDVVAVAPAVVLEYPQFLTPEMSRMPDFIGRDEFLEVK